MASVSGRRSEKVKSLRILVTDGKVSKSGSGKRGDPYVYCLTDTVSGKTASGQVTAVENQRITSASNLAKLIEDEKMSDEDLTNASQLFELLQAIQSRIDLKK
jgi:hypothetical protein